MSDENIAREMTPLEVLLSDTHSRLVRLGRKLPRLVWYDDEVDVTVTFTADKLPAIQGEAQDTANEAMRELFSGPLLQVKEQFARLGITFDTGMGFSGRDWEWDWSLKGPISVRFRSRAKKPELRKGASCQRA